ncbi:RICIN domain-containing protein, partial [Streptomyces katsurahamanus]
SGKLTEIRNHHSGMCLDAANGSTADGAIIAQRTCNGMKWQKWRAFFDNSSGAYQIVNEHSQKCLEVLGGSTADGASVVQSSCYGTPPQYWY